MNRPKGSALARVTLSASPWEVTQPATWTPIDAILRSPTQTPTNSRPSRGAPSMPTAASGLDHRLLQRRDVRAQVAAQAGQVDDGVGDQLPGPVVRRAPSAVGLGDVDAARRERGAVGQVGGVGARAERDHGLVLQHHDGVGQRVLGARGGELLLQPGARRRRSVRPGSR